MHIPQSTYRVQLHKGFTFKDLSQIIDYLSELGISTIYAAPIFKATPGSVHGYDVTDPHHINPEIGTLEDLRSLRKKLKAKGMSWIQDIVPNHMAFHKDNVRLWDVLERGPHSPYYTYFDILWDHHVEGWKNKLQVPFLGKAPDDAIADQEINLAFGEDGFQIQYFDTRYPLSLSAYNFLKDQFPEGVFCCNDLQQMGERAVDLGDWQRDKESYVAALLHDSTKYDQVKGFVAIINSDPRKLKELLHNQFYILDYWKNSEWRMNYRRFFTVNELICLRMEDEKVFEEYHQFILQLFKEGLIQGLRVDHIDGLKDPGQYITRLRKTFGQECYIIAEKILEEKEEMPLQWPLEGTSGYEYLAYTNQLMTNRKGAATLVDFYKQLVPSLLPYPTLVVRNKTMILSHYMAGEWDNLVELFASYGFMSSFSFENMKQALGAIMIALPVYRIYPQRLPLPEHEQALMVKTFQKAVMISPAVSSEIEYVKSLFLGDYNDADKVLEFLQRLMQFTGPLTAKGVEDTTFYMYNALISHDEVGDAPGTLGISIKNFHRRMESRAKRSPLSLNASATHDTKRGEDARQRLNALCEYPEEWMTLVDGWFQANTPHHVILSNGKKAPSKNDEYYIYQSVIGGFPEDLVVTEEWINRLLEYQTKAVREAKVYSDWAQPDEEYESGCHQFIRAILEPHSSFLVSLTPFLRKIIALATVQACGQVLLKATTPGIPDIYQGCELFDLSFVDPDNRRPVNFLQRRDYLDMLQMKEAEGDGVLLSFLDDHAGHGVGKLFTLWKVLQFRRSKPELFRAGSYIPLEVHSEQLIVIAFARVWLDQWSITIIPLSIKRDEDKHLLDADPGARVLLPPDAPTQWKNVFTNEKLSGEIRLAECLARFPIALLYQV